MPPKGRYRYTKEQLEKAVRTSTTIAEVLRKIGLVPRGANYEMLRKRCRQWDIDMSHLERRHVRGRAWIGYERVTDEEISRAVRDARSRRQALAAIGAPVNSWSYGWLNGAIERLHLDTGHMTGMGWRAGSKVPVRPPAPLSTLLVEGRFVKTSHLRRRLIEEGLKAHRCEGCDLTEWHLEPIPLELDHINGQRDDNRLENLRLLCPNCHALTPTYRGRNIGNGGTVCGEHSVEYDAA